MIRKKKSGCAAGGSILAIIRKKHHQQYNGQRKKDQTSMSVPGKLASSKSCIHQRSFAFDILKLNHVSY